MCDSCAQRVMIQQDNTLLFPFLMWTKCTNKRCLTDIRYLVVSFQFIKDLSNDHVCPIIIFSSKFLRYSGDKRPRYYTEVSVSGILWLKKNVPETETKKYSKLNYTFLMKIDSHPSTKISPVELLVRKQLVLLFLFLKIQNIL